MRKYTREEYSPEVVLQMEKMYDSKQAKNVFPSINEILNVNIVSKNNNYAVVDYGGMTDGFILFKNENRDIMDTLSVGMSADVMVTEENNPAYGVLFSVGQVHNRMRLNELIESIGDETVAYNCNVIKLIPNVGYNVEIDGIPAFMPGSLASMNLMSDPESIVGKQFPVMVVNFVQKDNTIVCSHKHYLKILVKGKLNDINKGDKFEGIVTGISDFGIFIEFEGCLTGMIHKTDLDKEHFEKYINKQILPGAYLNFAIKNIVNDKRIILTQLDITKDPWYNIESKYEIGKQYKGKVVDIKSYGLLIEFEPGVRGLYVSNENKYAVGGTIQVRIKSIDTRKHKIQLY